MSRRTCQCRAYPWPHRPGSGFCRWPNPPKRTWKGVQGKAKPTGTRAGRGIRKKLVSWMGWHPIRDRVYIHRWLPKLYVAYCRRRGFVYVEEWLRYHGVAGIPAMRVTPDGYDSKNPRHAKSGTAHPRKTKVPPIAIGSGRSKARRRVEEYDVWAIRSRRTSTH